MKYFSMFSGIGGFELGIQKAIDRASSFDGRREFRSTRRKLLQGGGVQGQQMESDGNRTECIGYSEIDKYAIKVYERHFNHDNYGDATTIDTNQLPDFDLLVGGFPCQTFSVAGKRKGFDEARGTLFFDIARILKDKRPRHLVLENVKGLLSHDGGKTFSTIIGVLTDIGYDVEWQVLNSKDFGVPQNRERVFIVGHLGGDCGRKVFPVGQGNSSHLREITQGVSDAQRIYTTDLAKSQKALGGGLGAKTGLYAVPAQWRRTEKGKAFRREAQLNGRDLTPFNEGYRELVPKDSEVIGTITSQAIAKDSLLFDNTRIANTIDANYYKGINSNPGHASSTRGYEINSRIRRLTPKECERLQGFPDDWTAGESDTQRYKMCGNAVTVNVIEAIFKYLREEVGKQL